MCILFHPINFSANSYILSFEPCAFKLHVLPLKEVGLNPQSYASLKVPLKDLEAYSTVLFMSIHSQEMDLYIALGNSLLKLKHRLCYSKSLRVIRGKSEKVN